MRPGEQVAGSIFWSSDGPFEESSMSLPSPSFLKAKYKEHFETVLFR